MQNQNYIPDSNESDSAMVASPTSGEISRNSPQGFSGSQNSSPLEEFLQSMVELLSGIQDYKSPFERGDGKPYSDAERLAEEIIQNAALKTAAISATCSLPPGPMGFLTILPELILIFRVQGYMVKDIASVYGKEAHLTKELLLFSLFKNGGAHIFRKFVEETSVKILIRPTTVRAFQGVLQRIGLNISRRILRKNLTRWIPLAGALLTGGFTYFDTKTVGKNAKEIFSKEIIIQERVESEIPAPSLPDPASKTSVPSALSGANPEGTLHS